MFLDGTVCDWQVLVKFWWWPRSCYVKVRVTSALAEVCSLGCSLFWRYYCCIICILGYSLCTV